MTKRLAPMTTKSAARIQSHADRTQTKAGFKERAQRAAAAPPIAKPVALPPPSKTAK